MTAQINRTLVIIDNEETRAQTRAYLDDWNAVERLRLRREFWGWRFLRHAMDRMALRLMRGADRINNWTK